MAEQIIHELERRSIETMQFEEQREKRKTKMNRTSVNMGDHKAHQHKGNGCIRRAEKAQRMLCKDSRKLHQFGKSLQSRYLRSSMNSKSDKSKRFKPRPTLDKMLSAKDKEKL